MNLTDINKVSTGRRGRKRIGRGPGSGQGCTSGKGHKGHKARSGYSRRAAHEGGQLPLFRRIPKRGFNNKVFRTEYSPVNVGQLAELGADTIDPVLLEKAGLVHEKRAGVKVLGDGKVDRALTVKAHRFSKSARSKIEAAGGTVEVIG